MQRYIPPGKKSTS